MVMLLCRDRFFLCGTNNSSKAVIQLQTNNVWIVHTPQKTDDYVSKTNDIVRNYRRMSIRTMADTINVDKETVRQISHDQLNTMNVCD